MFFSLFSCFFIMADDGQAKEKMDSSSESEHDLGQIPPLAMIAHAV